MQIDEEGIFQLITHSGAARSDIFEAFQLCRNGQYEEARLFLNLAKEKLQEAHKIQTMLIQHEADGHFAAVRLLMVHAQDHLMTCILAKDIMANLMEMQKDINQIKEKMV